MNGTLVEQLGRECRRDQIVRVEPDGDINNGMPALLLEEKGIALETAAVARTVAVARSC